MNNAYYPGTTMLNYAAMRKEHKRILEADKLNWILTYEHRQHPNEVAIDQDPIKDIVHKHVPEVKQSTNTSNKNAITNKKSSKAFKKFCGFCRSNGEPPDCYENHTSKDENNITVCPILRKHFCEFCNATGDYAHTVTHCPQAFSLQGYQRVNTNMMIKNCKIKSNGQLKTYKE